jgi:hypothetical protein
LAPWRSTTTITVAVVHAEVVVVPAVAEAVDEEEVAVDGAMAAMVEAVAAVVGTVVRVDVPTEAGDGVEVEAAVAVVMVVEAMLDPAVNMQQQHPRNNPSGDNSRGLLGEWRLCQSSRNKGMVAG